MKSALAIGACLIAAQVAAVTPRALSAPATQADSFAQWARSTIHPAVARIVVPGNGSVSYGSGTLIYADDQYGLVVTNWHVVNEAAGPVSVHFPDGFYSLGKVQSIDHDWDLAAVVIRKPPRAEPVALANRAPRPGEMLTIAGYGSGQYRAVSGPCTQYVAPGLEFPYEMVELAASARQGDSGGPIFNDQGELAGVLFGEGNGRTSGSYCGRVRWFLSRIVPQLSDPGVQVARTATPPMPASTPGPDPAPLAKLEPPPAPPAVASPPQQQWQAASQSTRNSEPPVASTRSPQPQAETVQLTWRDVAGETWGQQTKTVLAGIGVLAIILQALRLLSREEATE